MKTTKKKKKQSNRKKGERNLDKCYYARTKELPNGNFKKKSHRKKATSEIVVGEHSAEHSEQPS